MLFAESGRQDWRIHGTDVSSDALRRARAASFGGRELRGLSLLRRERFLHAADTGRFTVAPGLRSGVEFAAHNLATQALPVWVSEVKLVLLRNVLIYFEDQETTALLARLAATLPAGAWILLGGSEVLNPVPGFDLVRIGAVYAYRAAARHRSLGRPHTAVNPPPAARVPVGELPSRPSLLQRGERHAAAAEHTDAIRCFRRLVYLDPEDLEARLLLALTFEAAGDDEAGERAYRATLAALARRGEDALPDSLAGYGIDDLVGLIGERLGAIVA